MLRYVGYDIDRHTTHPHATKNLTRAARSNIKQVRSAARLSADFRKKKKESKKPSWDQDSDASEDEEPRVTKRTPPKIVKATVSKSKMPPKMNKVKKKLGSAKKKKKMWEDSDSDESSDEAPVTKTKAVPKQKVKTSQPKKQSTPKSKRKRTFIQNSHSHLLNNVEIHTTCM